MAAVAPGKVDNGVHVGAPLDAREALTAAPEAAKFNLRATCKWVNGTHSRTNVKGFFGLGQEQTHKTEFTFDVDHPEVFASVDHGATPVELVRTGLAGCLTAGVLVVGAAATGVQLADEIQRSGRPVTLAVGEHIRVPRIYRGRDIQW